MLAMTLLSRNQMRFWYMSDAFSFSWLTTPGIMNGRAGSRAARTRDTRKLLILDMIYISQIKLTSAEEADHIVDGFNMIYYWWNINIDSIAAWRQGVMKATS